MTLRATTSGTPAAAKFVDAHRLVSRKTKPPVLRPTRRGESNDDPTVPRVSEAAGNPGIVDDLKKGKQIGGTTYKVHLDGYDQTDVLTGKGPSKRHEIFYFAESTLGAVRIDDYKYRFIDQPNGWLGGTVKVDWPILVNLRLDPFERTGLNGSLNFYHWFVYEFWRFVFVKQEVAKYAQTFLEYPPMQKGATFNLEALKAELEKKMEMLKSQQGS